MTKAIPAYDVLASHYIARDMMAEARSAADMTFTLAPWYPPVSTAKPAPLLRFAVRVAINFTSASEQNQ